MSVRNDPYFRKDEPEEVPKEPTPTDSVDINLQISVNNLSLEETLALTNRLREAAGSYSSKLTVLHTATNV